MPADNTYIFMHNKGAFPLVLLGWCQLYFLHCTVDGSARARFYWLVYYLSVAGVTAARHTKGPWTFFAPSMSPDS